ncbi:PREDICTED: amyotrophic lateral sclerosis 2 chromosomal region candidate gene 11 protein isoform X2 [Miniopterus natalensis]|uniref:amyotrophic lateral sclerosis 2 chromosomal region candidate gene 11 protein isoform X2 n=1 Tax=Miniopterus natalensis TaxID=291302 RepID=UPI0007A6B0E7|nr:PREDICTED: amyotrophic lateral sclerosis 2 chromosomal region candidate gene 11 protein isoform X2 [Miniopterus natalensis]
MLKKSYRESESKEHKVKPETENLVPFGDVVPKRQDDVRNNIYLDLVQYDNKENDTLVLGRVQLHLYEIIQKGCFTEEFQMLNEENTFICSMEVEFMFSYGNFGYGFSHQLKPLQKIVEPSMFMNTAPPPERTDPATNIIIPQSIEYPAFLSPDLNVTVGIPASVTQSSQPSVVRLEKLQQQPRERLEKMKKEYRDLPTWEEKATYLEKVLGPKLKYSEHKGNNIYEAAESQFENPEDTVTSDTPLISDEAETIPSELMNNDDEKSLTGPTLNQPDRDSSSAIAPKSVDSTKHSDIPLINVPKKKKITRENKITPLEEHQPESTTDRRQSNTPFLLEVKLPEKHPSILKGDSTTSESSHYSLISPNEYVKFPNFSDEIMQDKTYGWLNTNKKGKSVAFSQKEHMVPALKPDYKEFKPKYQNFNTKNSFDSFLRDINNKMSVSKRNNQDRPKYRNSLNAEVIEHEDQDPPYLTHSKAPRPTDENWPSGLGTSAVGAEAVGAKGNLACDPSITTTESLDITNQLKERLASVSLPNFERESSPTENVNICQLSKSLSLTPHEEHLKQSVVLKSVLSNNLQDHLEKLFSKPGIPMDTEARGESHNSPLLSVHDKPSSSLEDKILEKIQDLNSWLSKEDILNSKSLVNPIIKDIPGVSLSEDGPGNSPERERALVSEKCLEAGEITFPIKKKSSFKKKHLESKLSSSESGFSDIAHDYVLKQIFTAPIFSKLEMGVEGSSESEMNWQNQLLTAWENFSSNILVHYEENYNEIELPEAKSAISQIIQTLPVDNLLESGIIKVIELGQEYQKSSLLDTETAFAEEKPKDSTEDYSEIKSKTYSLSKQNIAIIPKESTSFFNRVEFIDKSQNTSPQDSKYQSTPDKKTDLPSSGQKLDGEENDLSSTLENLSNLLLGKLNEPDVIMLKSFFKNILNVFLKYNQSEKRRQPEKELERLIQHPFLNNAEDLEEIKDNFDKADKLNRKPCLNPKLRVFLEALSESEIKNFKSELSKHIQHYLVQRLSESGHITKEDLPKICQNLYLMNEKAEPKGQNVFLEKYSEIVKETVSFVNNFNHHFIDKHLEIRLRSFLNEVLQNYFLKNLSESSLFKETESTHSNISFLRTRSASVSFHELGQDISKGSFGRRLEINMKYPLNKSLQNCLIALSQNDELLNLKADLSKYLQILFIEKLSKSGVMIERQVEGISSHINLIKSSSTSLKCIKPDLSFRDQNQFMEEHSEKQNKYSNIVHQATVQKAPEDRVVETELTGKKEKEYFPLQNIKENTSIITEQETLNLIKVQPSSNRNTQAVPLKKSSDGRTAIVLKKQREQHGFMKLPQAENFDFKTEIQTIHSWSGKSKVPQANVCFESTLKMKSLEKKEHNIYKLMAQDKPEAGLPPWPGSPSCRTSEAGEPARALPPPRQSSARAHFSAEAAESSKLDQFCQRLKGRNNNNKKQQSVTFAHYEKEIQALYIKPSEIFNEKCAKVHESQSFKYKVVEAGKNSKPSLFPEVLKRENPKSRVRKEKEHTNKQKKSPRIVKVLPTTPPAAALRKSVPRTLLHWTARRTVHDCSERFEDLPVTSFQHLEKVKSRARLLEKSPDDSHDLLKHFARPNTAPGVNKRRESYTGKFTGSRMVSAGLLHLSDKVPDYEIYKMQPKKI